MLYTERTRSLALPHAMFGYHVAAARWALSHAKPDLFAHHYTQACAMVALVRERLAHAVGRTEP